MVLLHQPSSGRCHFRRRRLSAQASATSKAVHVPRTYQAPRPPWDFNLHSSRRISATCAAVGRYRVCLEQLEDHSPPLRLRRHDRGLGCTSGPERRSGHYPTADHLAEIHLHCSVLHDRHRRSNIHSLLFRAHLVPGG